MKLGLILVLILSSIASANPSIDLLRIAPMFFTATHPRGSYDSDPGHNYKYLFGIYEVNPDNPKYADPDFMSGVGLPTPLLNPLYYSYDVIVVVNRTDVKIADTDLVEPKQTMRVYVRPEALDRVGIEKFETVENYNPATGLLFFWRVSTARPGATTPAGFFTTQGFSSDHYSSLYNSAPMPWTIFFNGNIGSHGVRKGASVNPVEKLGTPASAGCVRMEPQRARDLFHLIGHVGTGEVDMVSSTTGAPVLDKNKNIRKKIAYKTLIIVR